MIVPANDDLRMIAELISAGKPKAASRLATALSELGEQRAEREKFEDATRWLLRHAAKLPCTVQTLVGDREDREQVVHSATAADPNYAPCDYVLQDCPKLRSLMSGGLFAK